MVEGLKVGESGSNAKYDWDALKQEFFNSDFLEVAPFIRQRLSKETANDSNMANQTKGWAEDKKEWKRKRMEDVQRQADKELIEKLKISLEDLLINKKLLFQLDSKYLEILGRMAQPNSEKPLTTEELNFFKSYQDKISEIYKRIQIELGLPINIQKLGLGFKNEIDKIKIEIITPKNRD
jgi:hypothetical protein